MSAILEQLGVNQTFFVQMAIFAVLLFALSNIYFKPFMKLFQTRHKRTVEDREEAERLMAEAEAKLEEYKRRVSEERTAARKDYEQILSAAKREEAEILNAARGEAKKITQEAVESANKQRDEVRKKLEADVETIANTISESLLRRRD